jgi:hypothetical protein
MAVELQSKEYRIFVQVKRMEAAKRCRTPAMLQYCHSVAWTQILGPVVAAVIKPVPLRTTIGSPASSYGSGPLDNT